MTGIDFTGDGKDKNTLSKNISDITSTQANRLEGEFGGLRLAQLQLLETTKSGINSFLEYGRETNEESFLPAGDL